MKVTKKSNGKTYNAEMIPKVMMDEGGGFKLDDPEFPFRNGQQLHEQYMMGVVTVVQPKAEAEKVVQPQIVLPANFAKVVPVVEVEKEDEDVTDVASEIVATAEKRVEMPKLKAKKKKKKGRGRFGKAAESTDGDLI